MLFEAKNSVGHKIESKNLGRMVNNFVHNDSFSTILLYYEFVRYLETTMIIPDI